MVVLFPKFEQFSRLNNSDANQDKAFPEEERTNVVNVAQLHASTRYACMLMNMAFLVL